MMIDSSGYTYAHEHLHIDLSGFKGNIDCRLDQYELISKEMRDLMWIGPYISIHFLSLNP